MSSNKYVILDPFDAAKAAISENLRLPEPVADGRINTLNNYGAMKFAQFSATAIKFIEIASTPGSKSMDIGAAYGEVCLEALKRGSTDCTAIDIEQRHLKILARRVYEDIPSKLSCLRLIETRIPNEALNKNFSTNFYDAILLDAVLHFLDSTEISKALHQVFNWLKPGGKVFASIVTYYVSTTRKETIESLDQQLQDFTLKLEQSEKIDLKEIPGIVDENHWDELPLSKSMKENIAKSNEPFKFFRFHKETAKYFFEQAGFIIEEIFYMTLNEFTYKLDGREYVAVIAKRPERNE